MDQFLSGVSRASIIRWTAIYLIIYAVVNACGGLVLGIAGGLAAGVGAMTAASGINDAEVTAATTQLAGIGGLSIVLALFYIISVPIFAVAAFGLWRRKVVGAHGRGGRARFQHPAFGARRSTTVSAASSGF